MAKLRIEAPLGKTLVVDVGDADPSEYDSLATAALDDYTSKMTDGQRTAMANLAELDGKGPMDELKGAADISGTPVKAGYAGISDLAAGNGLDQAVRDVNKVQNHETPETTASNVGSTVGGFFTPAQIAIQAGLGAALDASGLGPWITSTLKGWAGDAAMNAVGKIKNLAKSMGIQNLDAVGQFLLKPINVGGEMFSPIVTATSSAQDMLEAATAVQKAAGAQLGAVSETVDAAISDAANSGGRALKDSTVAIDLAGLKRAVAGLKEEAVGDLPNLGKRVALQFNEAMADLDDFIEKQLSGDTDTTFSELSAIKTKLGGLVWKHGSPLESKAALQDVYGAISRTLDDAASKAGPVPSAAYAQANDVYHKISAVVEGLEGKTVDARKWFDSSAVLGGLAAATGAVTHSLPAALAVPAVAIGAKVASNYAPQAFAAGLNASAPFLGSAFTSAIRALPAVGSVIAHTLSGEGE